MKQPAFFLAALLVPTLVFAQSTFMLKGKLTPAAKKTAMVYLNYGGIGLPFVKDSVKTTNGEFSFTGTLKNISQASVSIQWLDGSAPAKKTPNDYFRFYLDDKPLVLTLRTDSITRSTLKGSALTDDMNAYADFKKTFQDKSTQARNAYNEDKKKGTPDSIALATYRKVLDQLQYQQVQAMRDYVMQHPASLASVTALTEWNMYRGSFEPDSTLLLLSKLAPAVQKSMSATLLKEKTARIALRAIGRPAPLFTQNDVNGKPVKLEDFKGKYVLIDFWASWCGPCRRENPAVVAAYQKFKDRNFTILGVSLDNKKEDWLKAIEKDQLTWTHVSDLKGWKNEVAVQYTVEGIPQNFLLDPSGKIIATNLRGEELAKKLEEVLKGQSN